MRRVVNRFPQQRLLYMRPAPDGDISILRDIAARIVGVLSKLPTLHCALDLVYQSLVDADPPCWRADKAQRHSTIAEWRGGTMTCTLRVVWRQMGEGSLQARFVSRDERALQGLHDAGYGGDLRDYKRHTALLGQQSTTCIIDVNRPLTLPSQV